MEEWIGSELIELSNILRDIKIIAVDKEDLYSKKLYKTMRTNVQEQNFRSQNKTHSKEMPKSLCLSKEVNQLQFWIIKFNNYSIIYAEALKTTIPIAV